MKKFLLTLAAVVITGAFLTACSSTKNCPAYSKAPVEQPAEVC
ncbi:MAG: hypothetical protein RBT71_14530 [Flavobacteriales bacterium]|jgi:hypothetical protein|nr:hypothetical protein [Flavobacteriales bacterium]